MSYDLAMWRSKASVRAPLELWQSLHRGAQLRWIEQGVVTVAAGPPTKLPFDEAKAMVEPLVFADVVRGFRQELGADLEVDESDAVLRTLRGVGWEFSLCDGDYHIHITCRWGTPVPMLVKLRRAALRLRCSTFDLQTQEFFEPAGFED